MADLLTLSRPESTPTTGAPPLDAGTVLLGVAEQLEPLAAERGVSLVVQAAPGRWVDANADRLKQVILHRVENRRRSTPAADPAGVDLKPREVTVTIDLKAGDARATVWTNDLSHAYVHENSAYSS